MARKIIGNAWNGYKQQLRSFKDIYIALGYLQEMSTFVVVTSNLLVIDKFAHWRQCFDFMWPERAQTHIST